MIHVIAFFLPLAYVFLRVFQQRNIAKDQEIAMVVCSFLITAFEIITINLVVTNGWDVYWSLAMGGSIGCVAATRFHKKYFGDK